MNDSPEPESGSSGPGVKRAVFRFGKDVKIKKSAEIRTLLAAGKRYSCRYFKVCYCGNGLTRSRFALITPRACGGAVTRNKIRRIMRELLRKGPLRELHCDIVFRLNHLTGSVDALALEGALSQWYESLKK
jgi:ribonuclease P protein component